MHVCCCRQEEFEKTAAGKAARAQMQGMAKQSANSNKGEPVLKVLFFSNMLNRPSCEIHSLYNKIINHIQYVGILFEFDLFFCSADAVANDLT